MTMPAGAKTVIALAPEGQRNLLREAYGAVPIPAVLCARLIGGDDEQRRALRCYERALANWSAGDDEHRYLVEQEGSASRFVEVMAVDAKEAVERANEGDWIEDTESEWDVETDDFGTRTIRVMV